MYTCEVQFPEFEFDEIEKMGPMDVAEAVDVFRTFPFEVSPEETISIEEEGPAATIWFRAPSGQPTLMITSMQPGMFGISMENFGTNVSVESGNREFIVGVIERFFSGQHDELYESLAQDENAQGTLGFMNRLKRIVLGD